MTPQQIFNKSAKHLLKQGQKAMSRKAESISACAYRTKEGLMCAVGCLIPEEMYSREMEGMIVNDLLSQFPHVKAYICGKDKDNRKRTLLDRLQIYHDYHASNTPFTKEKLNQIAVDFNLKPL